MNDMTDLGERQEGEYEYEFSEFGWTRRLKATAVSCAPLADSDAVTAGLITTMTGGHLDTSRAVPAAGDTRLTRPPSTSTTPGEGGADSDTDQIEYSGVCTGQATDKDVDVDVDLLYPPVRCRIIPISPAAGSSNSQLDASAPAVQSNTDSNCPLGDYAVDVCNDPTVSPTDSNYSSLDTSMSSMRSSRELNSPLDVCGFISAQVDTGKDPAASPTDTGVDLTSEAIEGDMDHTNPLVEDTEDLLTPSVSLLTPSAATNEAPTISLTDTDIDLSTDTIEGDMDHLNPLLEDTEDLLTPSVTSNEDPTSSPNDTNILLCSHSLGPPAHCSSDPISMSVGICADSINPTINRAVDFQGDLETSETSPACSGGIGLTPDTINDLVCDAQYQEIVPHVTDKQDETVTSIMEQLINFDSQGLTQTTNEVIKEPLCQCPPDVGEEPTGISDTEERTLMDIGSMEEDGQQGHLEMQTDVEPEEPHGHQEESPEGRQGSEDCYTCTVTEYFKDVLTADFDCKATVEQEAVGYCDTHPLIQTDENFMTRVSDLRCSEGESAEGCITDGAFIPHPLTHSFQNPETESPPLSETCNWDQSETAEKLAAVAQGDLDDASAGKEEVGLKSEDCDSANELWLDACQFLAGEANEESILDEWGHSPPSNSSRASTSNTKESCSPEGAASSKPVSDSTPWGPPVERWSSTDSWVSALSDWAPALSAHPEDPFTGESLPEAASMAIQDQAVEQCPDGSSHNGQVLTTLPQNLLVPGGHNSAEVRDGNQTNSRGQTSDPGTCCCLPPPSHKGTASAADMGAACDTLSAGDTCVHHSPSDCSCNRLYGDGYRIQADPFTDLYHQVPPSLQLPYDVSGQEYIKAEASALWEVTGDGLSLPVLSIEEEGERNYGSLNISDYSSRAVPSASGEEEVGHSAHAHRLATNTGPLTYALDQTASPECGSHQEGDKSGLPQFIMPLAPFRHPCIGSTPQQLINCTLPGDHLGRNYTNSNASIIASLLPPYARNHLKTHQELPVAKETGEHVTCELRSSSDTSDASTSPESSSPPYASSSSDEQAALADLCPEKSVDKESLQKASEFSKECTKQLIATGERFAVFEQGQVASLTLDLDYSSHQPQRVVRHDPLSAAKPKSENEHKPSGTMPHKTSKAAEGKGRSRHRDRSGGHHSTTHASKKQENVHPKTQNSSVLVDDSCEDGAVTVIETIVITEKITPKAHGKKKKKHHQAAAAGKTDAVPLAEVENGAKQKTTNDKVISIEPSVHVDGGVKHKPVGKTDTFEAKLAQKASKGLDKPVVHVKKDTLISDVSKAPRLWDDSGSKQDTKKSDSIRRVAGDKHGVLPTESKLHKLKGAFESKMEANVLHRKAYSEVVKEKKLPPKQGPQVVEDIQALPVFNDPQSICLRCKFGTITANSNVTWTKGLAVLSETQKSAGDESQVSLTLLKACSKDLGMYRCLLHNAHGSAFSDFHLTSEVLCELVIPSHTDEAEPTVVEGDEEDVQCAPLLFKDDDFLSEQYFGEHQPASIVTEKEHFGEGMHRKAFRATLRAGMMSVFNPGHPCVLKVHNAISHGAKDNNELVQRNYSLAAEECYVQNTAREYIKAYNNVAKTAESFGEVPEIIPIYLVHRPSNDIPYATLEEELRGDFVKYSVKDGKEINLMRRDSEAGQKCCAFQHWVYTVTDGNLLVTDMQGVGMRLTDVGIATGKKGYKGFKGNCATSFIEQFKVLHQCNRFCELLGLISLQPKPKRTAPPAKPKPQPAPKKKTFGPTVKGKS